MPATSLRLRRWRPYPLVLGDDPDVGPHTGQQGHTYAFYSVATDNVGNVQATPSAAQATTTVQTQRPATPQPR